MIDKEKIDIITTKFWTNLTASMRSISLDEVNTILSIFELYHSKFTIQYNSQKEPNFHLNNNSIDVQKLILIEKELSPALKKLPLEYKDLLIKQIELIDKSIFINSYFELFDAILLKFINSQGREAGISILPKELSLLMFNLLDLNVGAKIYNPFAGYATFGIYSTDKYQYYGQEIADEIASIAIKRLKSKKSKFHQILKTENSIDKWNNFNQKFDGIISAPPFSRLADPIDGKWGRIRTFESFTIEKSLNDLETDGKLIILVPERVLFSNGQESNLMYHLIEQDYIESIISIPSGILENSVIKTSILVINKNKCEENKNYINFIDASSCIEEFDKNKKIINSTRLLDKIEKLDPLVVRKISLEQVKNENRNLNPLIYFIEDFKGIKLKDFASIFRGQGNHQITSGKLVKLKNLLNTPLNNKLNIDDVEAVDFRRNTILINESCLLLAQVGKDLKPTLFEYSGEPIFIDLGMIIALKIDESKVLVDYLINELHKEYVIDQLEKLSIGTAMRRISSRGLMNLKIKFFNLNEQLAIVESSKEDYINSRKRELQLEEELLGIQDESFREIASLKHTFRQYLNALKSNVVGTKMFIGNNENENITLHTIYSKNLNRTLGEHLDSLEGTVQSMSNLLTQFETNQKTSNVNEYANILDLISEAQNRFKNPERFTFKKTFIDEEALKYGPSENWYKSPEVSINSEDFYKIYSNIISNAVSHGFKDKTKKFLIKTEVTFENEMCRIEVSNNGENLPKDFTTKHLITRGEKTTDSEGSGIGGADIQKIIKKHKGSFELINSPTEEFSVKYIIKLPLYTLKL